MFCCCCCCCLFWLNFQMHSSYVDNLVLLGRLSDAICSMLSADISLVNAINSPDLQVTARALLLL